MSLIDQLANSSFTAKEAERYLMGIYRESSTKLSQELNATDPKGLTPLHLAVQRGDIELVEVLLSFDARTTVKTGGKTIEECAKELSEAPSLSGGERMQREKIYALLLSRGRWQADGAQQGVSFSRSIKAIQEAERSIQGAEGKNGVLIFGITGEGKSTLINYLDGVDYEMETLEDGTQQVKKTNSVHTERAAVGASTTSETLYPQVLTTKGSYVHVDMPGFEDTRGTVEEICAAASICMLTNQLASVQAICLVTSWGSLADARMVNYRKSAESIGGMVGQNSDTADNLILVVTKPLSHIKPSHVQKRLEALARDEKFSERSGVSTELSADERKKWSLQLTTESIVKRGESGIVLADVTSSAARVDIPKIMERLSGKRKEPRRFNFNGYSKYMNGFQLTLENIIIKYNELKRAQQVQREKVRSTEASVQSLKSEITDLTQKIQEFEKQKGQPFTEAQFDQKIGEAKEKLTRLRSDFSEQEKNMRSVELESATKKAQLDAVTRDGEKLIEALNGSWMCEKTPDRVEKDIENLGGPEAFTDSMGRTEVMQRVKVVEKKMSGTEKTISQPMHYTSAVPIQRFLDKCMGGHFEANGFSKGTQQFDGVFKSSPGAHGGVSVSIELYGNTKDFPETKDQLAKLTSEAESAQDKLSRLEKAGVKRTDLDTANDAVRKLEIEKIGAIGNHERTKIVCETQIQLLNKEKATKSEKQQQLLLQSKVEASELKQVELQLEVNETLFATLKKVITTLGFKSEVIDQFMALSAEQGVANTQAKGVFMPGRHGASNSSQKETAVFSQSA